MLNQKDKFDRFVEVIDKNADKQCKQIQKETEAIRKRELDVITEECEKEYKDRLFYEFQKTDTSLNRSISKINSESRQYLASYREQITDKVFSLAGEELLRFTESENYKLFLQKSLELIHDNFAANDVSEYCLYVNAKDEEKVKALCGDIKVFATDEILIGGIIGRDACGKVKIDDSLDTRLDNQREWFKSQSKLSVR